MSMQKHVVLGICASVFLVGPTFFVFASLEPFTQNLHQGDTGADVLRLQVFLNTDSATRIAETGPGSPGNETTYFGTLTADAVRRFQELHSVDILLPSGLSSGNGFFGSFTRAAVNISSGADKTRPTVEKKNEVVRPRIDSITPSQGGVGTKVVIYGEGFLPTGNTIGSMFEQFDDVPSSDGKTLEITIKGPFPKEFLKEHEDFYKENKYTMEYQITVTNTLGRANFMPFTFNFF